MQWYIIGVAGWYSSLGHGSGGVCGGGEVRGYVLILGPSPPTPSVPDPCVVYINGSTWVSRVGGQDGRLEKMVNACRNRIG